MDQLSKALTPTEIVRELDAYIVGQAEAKRAVAVALRNRARRQALPESDRAEITPKNILMIGPTGVGKTEIARRLAALTRAPFIKVEATKFTEVGYVGRDVESMIRDLLTHAMRLVEAERIAENTLEISRRVEARLLDLLDHLLPTVESDPFVPNGITFAAGDSPEEGSEGEETTAEDEDELGEPEYWWNRRPESSEMAAARAGLLERLIAGELDDERVQLEVEEANNPFMQVFTPGGIEEMGIDTDALGGAFGAKRSTRSVSLAEAREIVHEQESKKFVDSGLVRREAIRRTEQTGIIFIDEIDKVAGKTSGSGPDVSREGVQRDLLPIIEGSTVQTKFGPVRTDHILFIAAGAFHISSPSDLIPELQGRLPIRVRLQPLGGPDFRRILSEPRSSLIKQYQMLLKADGVELNFTDGALDEIASFAVRVNKNTQDIGARRLHTVLERLLQTLLFEAPNSDMHSVTLDAETVKTKLDDWSAAVELGKDEY